MTIRTWPYAIAAGALAITISGSAAAQETAVVKTDAVGDTSANAQEEDDNGLMRKAHEPLFLGVDFMLGFGTYPNVISQQLPQSQQIYGTFINNDAEIRTATFMFLGHYRFKKLGIGVRLPLISGHIYDDPAQSTLDADIFTTGNLEVSLDLPRRLSPQVRMIPEVALTFPTSPGSTAPYTNQALLANQPTGSTADQYQRTNVAMAAAYARGGEDDALFFNWRLGVTPRLTFDMKFNHTIVRPYLKIPIMFGLEQNPGTEEPVRIEAVGGIKLAQEVGPVQFGLRIVGMIPIAARTTMKTPMLSAWPEIRLQITPSGQFWVAGMIPLAGDYSVFNDGHNGGFQAGLGATF